jgi:hypothetical protein
MGLALLEKGNSNLMKPLYQRLGVALLALLSFQVSATTFYVDVNNTSPSPPYTNWTTAATNIQDAANVAFVAGGLILVTNGVYQTGGNAANGRIFIRPSITVQSVNGPAMTIINGAGVMRCALLSSGVTLSGFTLANGAALTHSGGGVSCLATDAAVVNCIFTNNSGVTGGGANSGKFSNCTFVGNIATNYGGGVYGGMIYQCSFIGNSAGFYGGGAFSSTLNNCVVSNNSAQIGGGGACLSLLNNCVLKNNIASAGGGACGGMLNNCLLSGNSASSGGAVAVVWSSVPMMILNNCTIYGNSASAEGGGLDIPQGTPGPCYLFATNCIVLGNTGPTGSNNNYFGSPQKPAFNDCCTAPLPANGTGNITGDPEFVNPAGNDFHLQSNSPCINSGNNACVSLATDLDGNPRIAGGTVDMGAYEFQSPSSVLSYAWAQQYGLPTDGSADFIDSDSDGMNNWREWRTGTIPTNASSLLQMMSPAFTNSPSGVTVTWQSVSGMNYFIQRSSDLGAQPSFSIIQSNIVGQTGTTSYTDTNAVGNGPFFYRVGVQ